MSLLVAILGMRCCPFLCGPRAAMAAEPIAVRVADPAVGKLFEIKLKRDEDRLGVRGNSEFVTFTVASKSGIGEAGIRRIGADWPKKVVLRLNLRGLEQLSIINSEADVTLGASVQGHGDHRQFLQVARGKTKSAVEAGSPYFTKIQAFDRKEQQTKLFPLEEGHFRLEIPAAMFKGNPKQLTIRWIDFFRS